jgi:AcrR family transcriptional regulator
VATLKRPGPDPILEAALLLFRRVGFGGTSVRDIAQQANVTSAALYHYFSSKNDILLTLMTRAMEQNLDGVENALANAGDGWTEQLCAIVESHVQYHTKHQAEAFVGNSELRSLTAEGRKEIVRMRDRMEEIFFTVISEGAAAGEFGTRLSRQATRAILAMSTAVATWYSPRGALSSSEVAAQYVQLALALVEAKRRPD